MIQKIVQNRGGLHNRLTRKIRLLPFSLTETREYLTSQNVSLDDKQIADLYMAVGGVPHYLSFVPRGKSSAQAIQALCFSKDGWLVDEFEALYASLFSNHEVYLKVIRALAGTSSGLDRNELLRHTGLSSGGNAREILDNLTESGFIEKRVPYGKKNKDQVYRLIDEYSLFYLKWIEPVRGRVARLQRDYWTSRRNSPAGFAWSGLAFENLCLKHTHKIRQALGIEGIQTEEGSWRCLTRQKSDSGVQIDLLIDRADRVISLCEMKYADSLFVIDKKYAENLRRKLDVFRDKTKTRKRLFLVMVTAQGLAPNEYQRALVHNQVTLADLF